jgi:putative acetyltransferase
MAALLTAPLHWAIFAFGAWGFWRCRPWILSWASIYVFYVALSHIVWSEASPNGNGWPIGLLQAAIISVPGILLLRAAGEKGLKKMSDRLINIRNFRMADANEVVDLFHGSVHSLEAEDFSAEQLEAWAPTPPDYSHWRERLSEKKPFVAEREGTIIGFIELEDDGHIDCFYTHKDFQRQGVGSALYIHLLKEADARGIQDLYVEASAIARPFFERENFRLEKTNRLERRGQILTNFSMRLHRRRQ